MTNIHSVSHDNVNTLQLSCVRRVKVPKSLNWYRDNHTLGDVLKTFEWNLLNFPFCGTVGDTMGYQIWHFSICHFLNQHSNGLRWNHIHLLTISWRIVTSPGMEESAGWNRCFCLKLKAPPLLVHLATNTCTLRYRAIKMSNLMPCSQWASLFVLTMTWRFPLVLNRHFQDVRKSYHLWLWLYV